MTNKKPWGTARIEVLAASAEIEELFADGLPQTQVFETLKKRGKITCTYRSFRLWINRHGVKPLLQPATQTEISEAPAIPSAPAVQPDPVPSIPSIDPEPEIVTEPVTVPSPKGEKTAARDDAEEDLSLRVVRVALPEFKLHN